MLQMLLTQSFEMVIFQDMCHGLHATNDQLSQLIHFTHSFYVL